MVCVCTRVLLATFFLPCSQLAILYNFEFDWASKSIFKLLLPTYVRCRVELAQNNDVSVAFIVTWMNTAQARSRAGRPHPRREYLTVKIKYSIHNNIIKLFTLVLHMKMHHSLEAHLLEEAGEERGGWTIYHSNLAFHRTIQVMSGCQQPGNHGESRVVES